jgi:hypothetical protein
MPAIPNAAASEKQTPTQALGALFTDDSVSISRGGEWIWHGTSDLASNFIGSGRREVAAILISAPGHRDQPA